MGKHLAHPPDMTLFCPESVIVCVSDGPTLQTISVETDLIVVVITSLSWVQPLKPRVVQTLGGV